MRSATLVAAALLAACRSRSAPIEIGIAGPFGEPRGRAMLRAAQLAVQQINEAGGVRGRHLVLDIRDDSAQARRAIALAQELRDNPAVVAVVGHLTSATTLAAADVYNSGAHPVVAVSPSASNPDLTGAGPYTFRVCATDLAHGSALAHFAFERLGSRVAAIVYLDDDYGRGIMGTFTAEFRRLGGAITTRDPVLPTTTDIGPYLERIKRDARAQVLMVAGDRATAATVLRQALERGIGLPVIGGDALSGIQSEGAVAEGVYITSNWLPDQLGEGNAAFLRAYAAATGGEIPDHRGAGAYDAVHVIADAIRDAGPDRRRIRDALADVGYRRPAYEGVTGRIVFDDGGDVPNKAVVVGVVRGGRIVLAGSR